MSFWNQEQFAAVQCAHLETSFALLNKALEHYRKIVDLNLDTIKSAATDSQEAVVHAVSGKYAREHVTSQVSAGEQAVARSQAYCSRLFAITTVAQAEFATVANEQYVEYQRRLHHLVDDAGRHVPASAEPAITALKSVIDAAGAWYESTRKATQQAIEVAEHNVEAVNSAVSKSTKRAAEQAERMSVK
jgi:phasin family protein